MDNGDGLPSELIAAVALREALAWAEYQDRFIGLPAWRLADACTLLLRPSDLLAHPDLLNKIVRHGQVLPNDHPVVRLTHASIASGNLKVQQVEGESYVLPEDFYSYAVQRKYPDRVLSLIRDLIRVEPLRLNEPKGSTPSPSPPPPSPVTGSGKKRIALHGNAERSRNLQSGLVEAANDILQKDRNRYFANNGRPFRIRIGQEIHRKWSVYGDQYGFGDRVPLSPEQIARRLGGRWCTTERDPKTGQVTFRPMPLTH